MNGKVWKSLTFVLVIAIMLFGTASAEKMSDLITVNGPSDGYSFYSSGNRLFISKPGTYTITNNDINTAVDGFIDIGITGSNKDITLILNGVNLKPKKFAPIRCFYRCNLTIQLADGTNNTLYGKSNYGIAVHNSSSLIINGKGTLYAIGGVEVASDMVTYYYSGIGPSNITIESGKVYATGAKKAPGIGGRNYTETYTYDGSLECNSDTTSNVTINGGYVEAVGGENAAGIGSGYAGTAENIVITGGTVVAKGGKDGAGIGSGWEGSVDGITITGGTVTALSIAQNGKTQSSAIGGGFFSNAKNIIISGGEIIASTDEGYNAIGYYYGSQSAATNKLKPVTGKKMLVRTGIEKDSITQEHIYIEETIIGNVGLLNYAHITSECISHAGGKATCTDEAICSACGKPYGSKDFTNHVGGTEVKNRIEATYEKPGYTGDTYCLGCRTKIADGQEIPVLVKPEDNVNDNVDTSILPKTGDNSHIVLWLALLTLAGTAIYTLKRKTA